jgi:tetratricopeptide (TPR) repeat protein
MSSTPVASPPDEVREAQPQRNRDGWWALLLVAAIAVAYVPVWRAGFIWDDDAHLTANPCIIGPLGLREIWTTAAANYFPLVLTNLWVQHALWGLNPLPYHLVNVAIHAACAVLLWRVLRRLGVPGAWLGGALWALHPVQVESVAWISELKNTQSCLFFLLAFWFFLRWIADDAPGARRGRDYALTLLCAVLAILSKPSTVMLPVVLALCWWWMKGRWSWRIGAWLTPFFAVSAIASGWTIWEQKYHSFAQGAEWNQSWAERLIIAGRAVWFYLGKLLWPDPLVYIYPRWKIDANQVAVYAPGVAAVILLAVLWHYRRGWARAGLFAYACFLALLFPVLGFFSVYFFRYSFVSDHFQYLASLGPAALAGAAITLAPRFWADHQPRWLWALGGVLLLGLGVLSWRQCGMYHDDDTLWRTTRDRNPTCWMAQNFVGKMFASTGHFRESLPYYEEALRLDPNSFEVQYNLSIALRETGRIEEAMAHCERSLQLQPGFPEANYDLGVMLAGLGRPDEAAAHYEQVLRIKPDYVDAHINLGVILVGLGRPQDAIVHYQAALRLKPDSADAHSDFGMALHALGRFPEAVTQFEQATRLNPGSAEIHNNLGVALDHAGRVPDAIAQGEEALRLKPDYPEAHNNLGTALREANRLPEAIQHYEAAIRLRRDYLNAQYNLGLALALAGRPAEAIPHYQEALRLKPDSAEAHGNLANALLALGRNAEAIAHLQRALEIDPNQAVLHYNLALVLRALGRSPEANPHYEQARRLRPDLPPWRN